jgi:hypothetical protein
VVAGDAHDAVVRCVAVPLCRYRSSDPVASRGYNTTAMCVLDEAPSVCTTGTMPNAWWVVDFTSAYRIRPTAYTIRDGFNDSLQVRGWGAGTGCWLESVRKWGGWVGGGGRRRCSLAS